MSNTVVFANMATISQLIYSLFLKPSIMVP